MQEIEHGVAFLAGGDLSHPTPLAAGYRKRHAVLLHKMQQQLYDEARFLPIWELGFLCASGPRVAVSGMGLITLHSYSAPFEDLQRKS